jgi:hypothetical protein
MSFAARLMASMALFVAEPALAGVMLGAHIGAAHDPNSKADFTAVETAIGRKLAIDNDHEDWEVFPNVDRIRWDAQNGRLSMLSWRIKFDRSHPNGGCATADAINAGTYDAQLKRQAQAIESIGRPVLIRFNYEMTGNKEDDCFAGFRVKSNIPLAASKYVTAWRHVVGVFRSVGATNARWVFAPGHGAYANGHWKPFYPGDAYVDWIAVDCYNKSGKSVSFADDPGIQAFYRVAAPMGKPLMVSETGAPNDPRLNPDPQTVWLNTARAFLKSKPAIKAFVWWSGSGRHGHRRHHSSDPTYAGSGYMLKGSGLAAFRAMASDPYFQASADGAPAHGQ